LGPVRKQVALTDPCIPLRPAEVDIVAVPEGKIAPSGRTKVIQSPPGDWGSIGVVKTIAVNEGQKINLTLTPTIPARVCTQIVH
jgi:multidrug efflux pump subunit AcrA (membrane-fusion protein)